MPKYLSGRAKRVPQDQLTEDRYQYLGLDQAEPNLSDPLVSPSVPSGAQYQLVAVPAFPGKRYWVPVGGGLVPGAITIFDEDSPVSSSSSITQLNFVGAAVTANVSVQHPSGHPGIAATVTVIPVTVGDSPPNTPSPNEGELWWESDTGDLYIYYNDGNSAQWVTTNAGGRGLTGDKGQKGEVGQTGLTGNAGAKGDKGEKGQKGDVEAQGNKGQKGEIGVGQKGQKGEAGTNGTDGQKGQKGEDNSTKGQKGEVGIGQKGQKGEKGTSGGGATVTISDNAPGSPSAGDMWWDSDDFDLHVYYGDGDSNQWVSITSNAALKGQKGEKGEKGQKGEKGEKGQKGQKGEQGLSGNAGGKGEKGEKGQKGVDGNSIKGTKGDKGEIGQKGQKGEDNSTKGQKGDDNSTKGQKGDKGQTGADNSTKGQKGQKGEVGPQGGGGVGGDKGQKGEQGIQGVQGNPGSAGTDAQLPVGTIVAYGGNSAPSGWQICNGGSTATSALQTILGQSTVPDLRDRFIIGAGSSYSRHNTGGSKDATLVSHSHTVNNHSHTFSGTVSNTNLSHSHSYSSANHPTGSGPEQNQTGSPEDRTTFNVGKTTGSALGNHAHTYSGTTSGSTPNTNTQGSSATNANLPPYYALIYIIKT